MGKLIDLKYQTARTFTLFAPDLGLSVLFPNLEILLAGKRFESLYHILINVGQSTYNKRGITRKNNWLRTV